VADAAQLGLGIRTEYREVVEAPYVRQQVDRVLFLRWKRERRLKCFVCDQPPGDEDTCMAKDGGGDPCRAIVLPAAGPGSYEHWLRELWR
jgi:hypothetical protein